MFSFITRAEVIERRGRSLSHQLRDEEKGRYPIGIKNGRSCSFVDYEVGACMGAELNGATDEQMRALVQDLVNVRRFTASKNDEEMRAIVADLVAKHSAPLAAA